jgi:hypothetical protein
MKALDAARMHQFLSDDYSLRPSDGSSERRYNRSMAFSICAWEKGMHTRWQYQIIGVQGSNVTAVLIERNDYFKLLGLGQRTQVTTYSVENGKIRRTASKLVVELYGTQNEALGRFKEWLRGKLDRPDPAFLTPEWGLKLTGESASPMLHWLKRWHQSRSRQGAD